MKRASLVSLILMLLIYVLAGSLLVNSANANPIGYYYPWSPPPNPIVKVTGLNTVELTLTFIVQKEPWITPYGMGADYEPSHQYLYSITSIRVLIDGKQWSQHDWTRTQITVSLEGVSNGWHTLEVTATAGGGDRYISHGSSGVINFNVDNPPPSVQVQSLKDTAVNEGDFQFLLRVEARSLSWVGYSLDGKGNVTINQADLFESSLGSYKKTWTGNLTLTVLSSGLHSLVVCAKDQFGQTGASNIKEFMVSESVFEESAVAEETLAVPFPTTSIGNAIIASVALVSFGLVAYFVRRNRSRSK